MNIYIFYLNKCLIHPFQTIVIYWASQLTPLFLSHFRFWRLAISDVTGELCEKDFYAWIILLFLIVDLGLYDRLLFIRIWRFLYQVNLLVNMFIWRFCIKDIIFFLNLLVRRSTLVRHALWVRGRCHVSNSCFGFEVLQDQFEIWCHLPCSWSAD